MVTSFFSLRSKTQFLIILQFIKFIIFFCCLSQKHSFSYQSNLYHLCQIEIEKSSYDKYKYIYRCTLKHILVLTCATMSAHYAFPRSENTKKKIHFFDGTLVWIHYTCILEILIFVFKLSQI